MRVVLLITVMVSSSYALLTCIQLGLSTHLKMTETYTFNAYQRILPKSVVVIFRIILTNFVCECPMLFTERNKELRCL